METETLFMIGAIIIVVFGFLIFIFGRYRKCPSDKVMVIYGKVGNNKDGTSKSAKCIHGGASFIWPVIQSYQYLDLTPIAINVPLKNALCRQNIRIDVPSSFTVGISTEPGIMQNAAERLLGMKLAEVQELAKDIIFGQLRLINVNVTDITDESGYIEALGKEAAARAINDAKKSVAEKNRDGSIGEANAIRDQRVAVASADAAAIEGENEIQIQVANSAATRREKEAEALCRATAAEKVQSANALKEAYAAEQEAEVVRAQKEKATLEANELVKAEVEKRRVELAAEAEAEQIRRKAKGEADAIFMKMEAEARGMQEILQKQAEGFADVVQAAGGKADDAVKLILADKMEDLIRIQVEAVKNLKIDKVTVWDSMSGKDGSSTTSNFLSGLMKSVPPMQEMFDMAGMDLPSFLGKKKESAPVIEAEEAAVQPDEAGGQTSL